MESRNIYICKEQIILRLIYSRTTDFKSLSTVATMPDHQSSKTRCCCDSFDTEKSFVKLHVTFLHLLQKEDTSSYFHSATVGKFG